MNFRLTLYIQGPLLLFLGGMLLTPIPFALYYGDGQTLTFVIAAAIACTAGGALMHFFRGTADIGSREGFAIVTFAWLSYSVFGSLPYLFSGVLLNPVDAFFEGMAGFTTTGASVLTDIEVVAKSVLYWRALTQWLGGMGFIVLGVAVLPFLGVGGMQLYEAETPGVTADRLTPRIQDTARLLWGVYALLTAIGVVLLWLGEMSFFDALCHTFTAIATGGFSTRNASLGAFGTYSQVVILVLMVLGGASFTLHYYALRGRVGNYWKSDEFRFYLGLLAALTLIVFLFNLRDYDSALVNLRDAAFTVTSITTTTGFATADYERWPMLSQGVLFIMMFIGGCAGSTAGGIKHVRVFLLIKHAYLQIVRLIHPRQVRVLKLDGQAVTPDIMQDVLSITVLFIGVFVMATLLLAAMGLDQITSVSAAVACQGTIGPGLGAVGPMDNYAGLPAFAKVVLCMSMLLGRLEVATVLVLCLPTFWRKG
ncbi:MAG: TrkH family potassium uptake protein [Gemmataceae bacterium]|nr:TrkH family potassium uptake protein [Gemmataceae bacterium]